jgi:hypothetical protein
MLCGKTDIVILKQKTTKFEKIQHAYASRKGMTVAAFRFVLDGNRISANESPASLDLNDGDVIDVLFEQTGGKAC